MHLQRLEETGKPVANLQTHFGLEGVVSKHIFCSEEGFQVRTVLSLVIVASLHPTVTQTLELGQS